MDKICSMHNMTELENIICELKKYSFVLSLLTHLHDNKVKGHESEWYCLVCDSSDMLEQHISELDRLFDCICREVDFNVE